ncbi:hypothetical protein BpHYR1_017772 [Brachionus plicatilis]|uniref:Uncharacterized protein n=1 Tax=Brachionus plicatilis TaxID=10195 RepID=A0A3M7PFX8_BRAPC|nr:hypothetical protein BpHYR1_017772 [Brachionus plicatilis]
MYLSIYRYLKSIINGLRKCFFSFFLFSKFTLHHSLHVILFENSVSKSILKNRKNRNHIFTPVNLQVAQISNSQLTGRYVFKDINFQALTQNSKKIKREKKYQRRETEKSFHVMKTEKLSGQIKL